MLIGVNELLTNWEINVDDIFQIPLLNKMRIYIFLEINEQVEFEIILLLMLIMLYCFVVALECIKIFPFLFFTLIDGILNIKI